MITVLDRVVEKIQDHNPRAMHIVEPENKLDYNEFNMNIKKQLKEIYDTKTSIEAAFTESNRAYTRNR
jgi:hypothetical protein